MIFATSVSFFTTKATESSYSLCIRPYYRPCFCLNFDRYDRILQRVGGSSYRLVELFRLFIHPNVRSLSTLNDTIDFRNHSAILFHSENRVAVSARLFMRLSTANFDRCYRFLSAAFHIMAMMAALFFWCTCPRIPDSVCLRSSSINNIDFCNQPAILFQNEK